jgi:hypothetical protein
MMSNENENAGDAITYTAEDVVDGFGGVVTFSAGAAADAAKAINEAGPYGDLDPDEAGRRVQAALYEATADSKGRNGLRVSIDQSLTAVTAMHVRKARQGFQVGRGDQPGAARATSGEGADTGPAGGSGTAAASGAGSAGASAAEAPTGKNGKPLSGAAARSAARKRADK